MSWQEQIDFDRCDSSSLADVLEPQSLSRLTPGLSNTYNTDLREKAGMHSPPVPPELMGLEGEYDDFGLVRRLAQALDHVPGLAEIDTVQLIQHGSTVALAGEIRDRATLDRLVEVARRIDGTRSVDVTQVTVGDR